MYCNMTLWYWGLNLTFFEEANILYSETDVGWYTAKNAKFFTVFDFTWVVEFLFLHDYDHLILYFFLI